MMDFLQVNRHNYLLTTTKCCEQWLHNCWWKFHKQ